MRHNHIFTLNQYITLCNQTARFFTLNLFLYQQYFCMLMWCSTISEIEIYTYPLFGDSHVMFGALVQNDAMLWFSLHLYISQALLSAIHQLTFLQMLKFPNLHHTVLQHDRMHFVRIAQFEAQFWIKSETNT